MFQPKSPRRHAFTVATALDQVRLQAPSKETVYYICVIDDQHRLTGLVSLRDLILAKPAQTVGEITGLLLYFTTAKALLGI